MKGPYERLKYDLRREWQCPACQHVERTPGSVTFCWCRCQAQIPVVARRPMRLVHDGARRISPLHRQLPVDEPLTSTDPPGVPTDGTPIAPFVEAAPCARKGGGDAADVLGSAEETSAADGGSAGTSP
ncbi:MAG: hypothetical protein AB7F89_03475 [Pirellulaceae bacterium]